MIGDQKSWSIVVVGFWNRMIFTPLWVSQELFHAKEVEVLVPLSPVSPMVYRYDDIVLQTGNDRIMLNAQKATLKCLEQMEGIVCKLLGILPKTPISAIGVNFGFIEKSPEEELLKLFNFSDELGLGSGEWKIVAKKLVRKLVDNGRTLNLTLTHRSSSEILINANFHYKVESAEQAKERIAGKTVEMGLSLINLLKEVHNLDFAEGEADD